MGTCPHKVSTRDFLMPVYTGYSASKSRGVCGGACCLWETTRRAAESGALGEKCLVGAWCSLVEEWGSGCRERFLPVNDTSADFGWWRTALCSLRRTSFSAVRPGALPCVSFPTADSLGMCPAQMRRRCVCLCWRRGGLGELEPFNGMIL